MTLEISYGPVQEQLSELKRLSGELGERLESAARDLSATGLTPSANLITDLERYRELFQQVSQAVAPSSSSIQTSDASTAPATLAELEQKLTERLATSQVRAFVDQLQHLRHVESDAHPTLEICLRARQAVLDALRGPDAIARPTARTIRDGQHPLNALCDLLQRADQLNDDEWTESLDRVSRFLGRDVATAAARQKLMFAYPETSPPLKNDLN